MKKIIYSAQAPNPIGPYNQAVLVTLPKQNTLYTSGQIAIDPATGDLLIDDLENEAHLVMNHLKNILAQANMDFDNVIKATIFLSDMKNFNRVNTVYGSYFKEDTAPARETVEVANLPKYVNVEISVIAMSF